MFKLVIIAIVGQGIAMVPMDSYSTRQNCIDAGLVYLSEIYIGRGISRNFTCIPNGYAIQHPQKE